MNTRQRCICSGPLTRQPFSRNFDALRCGRCDSRHFVAVEGVVAVEFRYDGDNEKYAQREYLYGKQLRWAHTELLRQDWSGRKVLEIGCFNGFFLDELRKKGADVYGFDVNRDALKVGSDLFDLKDRLHGTMAEVAALGPFDDVLCIDVVEHIGHPEEFLKEVAYLLKQGGRVVVAGPTAERRFHDKSDYPPHHKWWFTREGMRSCLRNIGYEVAETVVQRDGMLFVRNLIGKAVHGLRKREFYGDAAAAVPTHEGPISRSLYAGLSLLGRIVFTLLGISYCSAIIIATKAEPA